MYTAEAPPEKLSSTEIEKLVTSIPYRLSISTDGNSHTSPSISTPETCLLWNWQKLKWQRARVPASVAASRGGWCWLDSSAGLVPWDSAAVGWMLWCHTKCLLVASPNKECLRWATHPQSQVLQSNYSLEEIWQAQSVIMSELDMRALGLLPSRLWITELFWAFDKL